MLSLLSRSDRLHLRNTPTQRFARVISDSAIRINRQRTPQFRAVIGYLGTWKGDAPGISEKLRQHLQHLRGLPRDLWERLERIAREYGKPKGVFTAYALGLTYAPPSVFGQLVEALRSADPDESLLRLLHRFDGRLPGMTVKSFSQTAYLFRPDLYGPFNKKSFVAPLKHFVSLDQYRRYPEVCRSLRRLCDEHGFPPGTRFSFLDCCIRDSWDQVEPIISKHLSVDVFADRTRQLSGEDGEGDTSVAEGRRKRLKAHMGRERKGRDFYIRLLARTPDGVPNACDICEMVPSEVYGEDYAPTLQVHHKDPIASGERKTEADDLAILCANCHLACHAWIIEDDSFDQTRPMHRRKTAHESYQRFRHLMRKQLS